MPVLSDFHALLSGAKWNGMTGANKAPVFVTYSFLASGEFPTPAEYHTFANSGYFAFTAAQRAAFRAVTAKFEAISGIKFIEVDKPQSASIKIMNTDGSSYAGWASYMYSTNDVSEGGRYVIDGSTRTATYQSGSPEFETMLHELGHSMGLKHPFEGPNTLLHRFDNSAYTLMSYTANGPVGTQPAPFDVQALKSLYGPASGIKPSWHWGWSDRTDTFTLRGSSSNDRLIGVDARSVISGNAGNDGIWGRDGNDLLSGGTGKDLVSGSSGNDRLFGGAQNDKLFGGSGDDALNGGLGGDTLHGGAGNDTYIFKSILESGLTTINRDTVLDFEIDFDKIDLRSIDASTVDAGNNAFQWIGIDAITTSTAGELRFRQIDVAGTANDATIVEIDNDGDVAIEASIKFKGLISFDIIDFYL
jgi:serralysin